MKNEFNSKQLDYLQKLEELCSLVPEDPVVRSEFLFNIRRLASLKISAGDSGDGATSLLEEQRRRQDLYRNLSSLGSESLLEYYRKEGNDGFSETQSEAN